MKHFFYVLSLAVAITMAGCDNDPHFSDGTYGNGVFIANQGTGTSDGKVSYIDRQFGAVIPNIYAEANGSGIGGQLQSLAMESGLFYLVCSSKIEIVDYIEFKRQATISGLQMAKRIYVQDSVAYITEWRGLQDSGWVRKVSLFTNLPVDTVKLGRGPSHMFSYQNFLYVSCYNDDVVHVIDKTSFSLIDSIVVGDHPENMEMDVNGMVWVMSSGLSATEPGGPTPGRITIFNPATMQGVDTIYFASGNPKFLRGKAGREFMYYSLNNAVYVMSVNSTVLPSIPLIDPIGITSALGVDYTTGFVYVADQKNGQSEGFLRWYNGSTGLRVDSFNIGGVMPVDFKFIDL